MAKDSPRRGDGIASGLFWSFGERMSAQAVATLVAMLLARLLDPADYGMISVVTVFVSLCNIFVTSGLGTAVVRKPDAGPADFNTAFWLSLGLAAMLYGLLFWAAPAIGRFYGLPALTAVMRVMGLRLILAALNNIQRASVQREMAFRWYFAASLLGTVLSGAAGVAAALGGLGVWALVIQSLSVHRLLWLEGPGRRSGARPAAERPQPDCGKSLRVGRAGLLRPGEQVSRPAGGQCEQLHQQRHAARLCPGAG